MGKLKVYYGWAKIGNVRKKRSLSIIFENDLQGCRSDRGQRVLSYMQDTVIERYQTEAEEKDGRCNYELLFSYDLPRDVYERRRWVIEWRSLRN